MRGEDGLYANKAALPRAFVVGAAEVLTASAIPARIAERDFDPRRAVLIERAPPPGFAGPTADAASTSPGAATVVRYRNESVNVEARMDRPGWLVLGDVNYPGWAVEVDGRAAPLYMAYYILRAVPLPAGTHSVRFYFRPASVLLGGAISLLALLAAVVTISGAYLARSMRRRPS
jgi:Bacterial membrane protein YfhO